MADFVNTIDLYGDKFVVGKIVDRTITEFNDDAIALIDQYAFAYCSVLTSVDLPNATSIKGNAFDHCTALTSVDLPNATSLGNRAFYYCSALTSVNLPNATSIEDNAFEYCKVLTSVNLPNATSIKGNTFSNCYALANVDFQSVTQISNRAFNNCSALTTLVLRSETLCTIADTGAFYGTPFASGQAGGTLLAPRSLVESYKTATNWSVYWGYGHNRFLALEDYTVDGTITGEIDWDKLNGGN